MISQASPEGFLISVTEYGQKNRHDVEEKELKEFLRLQNLASKDDKQTEGMLHKLNILKKKDLNNLGHLAINRTVSKITHFPN